LVIFCAWQVYRWSVPDIQILAQPSVRCGHLIYGVGHSVSIVYGSNTCPLVLAFICPKHYYPSPYNVSLILGLKGKIVSEVISGEEPI
jgi:hypothetical protein